MKFKNLIGIIFLVLILFTAVSFVSAEEVNDGNIANIDNLNSESNLNEGLEENLKVNESNTLNNTTNNTTNNTIKKSTKIIASNKYFIPKSGKYYTITLKDGQNNPLVGKNIKITLNKKTYLLKTNSKGQVSLKITLYQKKKYSIKIKFLGDKYYNKSSTTKYIIVKKFKTKIIATKSYFIPKSGKYYKITLKDQYNNLLSGKKLKITLNKKTYTRKTNKKGEAFVKIGLSTKKTYSIKIKFVGTKNYYKSSKTSKIIIKKESTKIIANAITCKAKTNVNYKITLKNKNNNLIKNRKISLTTNGKTYTKTTNSKGQVTFTLNMPSAFEVKKAYNAKIKFSGDYAYLKSSKTTKITVISKENMFITASNMTTLANNESYYEFRVYGNGNYSEKPIKVTITGNNIKKSYNLITNETGYAGFNFNETFGVYKVNIKFDEDKIYKSASKDSLIVSSKETTYVKASDILQAANTLKTYADKNLKLPNEVKVGNTSYSLIDFTYISGKIIAKIYNNTYDADELIEAPNFVSLKTESIVVSKALNKNNYVNVVNNFIKTCDNNYKNYNIRSIPSSISFKESSVNYSVDFKTYLYTYSNILTTYQKTGQLPSKIMFKSSVYCPKTISMTNIIKAAKTVANNIDTGKQVNPKSIKINGYYYSADEFSYLLAKTIINIKNKKTTSITLIDVSNVKSNENWKSININKKEYLTLASTLANKISSTNTLPAKIKTSKGYADLEFYVYAFSNILKYYSSKKALPSTAGVNTVYMYLTGDDFKHGFNERNKESDLDKYLETSGKSAINSAIKKLADKLTKGKSTWNKVKAIFNYVRDHVSYDYYFNSYKGAAKTLKTKKANCCDQTNLMVALLRASGIHARYSHSHYCRFNTGSTCGHVWGQALVGNVWVKLDPISKRNSIGVFKNINQKKTSVKTINNYALIPF